MSGSFNVVIRTNATQEISPSNENDMCVVPVSHLAVANSGVTEEIVCSNSMRSVQENGSVFNGVNSRTSSNQQVDRKCFLTLSSAVYERWERLRSMYNCSSHNEFMVFLLDALDFLIDSNGQKPSFYSKHEFCERELHGETKQDSDTSLEPALSKKPFLSSLRHTFSNGTELSNNSQVNSSGQGNKRSLNNSIDIACIESKRRKMADSRLVHSANSINHQVSAESRAHSFNSSNSLAGRKRSFIDSDNLSITPHHGDCDEQYPFSSNNNNYEDYLQTSLNSTLMCALCKGSFASEDEVRSHLSVDHHIYRFMCLLCGCTNDEEIILYEHVQSHHSRMFMCSYKSCGYTSGQRAAVSLHLITHHGVWDRSKALEGTNADKYYDKQKQYIVKITPWLNNNR